jgi:hypothetical protein
MKQKMIATFQHLYGGSNRDQLHFLGFKPINEIDTNWLFIRDENGNTDDDANFNEKTAGIYDKNEKRLISFEQWNSGVGSLEIDGSEESIYADYVEKLNDMELRAILHPGCGFYYLDDELDKALTEYGFTPVEVALARRFDMFDELVDAGTSSENESYFIKHNFDVLDSKPGNKADFYEFSGKYYVL